MKRPLTRVKQQWHYFLIALQFFTRVPVRLSRFNELELNHATQYFPLIGLLVGLVSAATFVLANKVLTIPLAVLLSMVCSILLTGAFHEDGLADMADGFGGGWKKDQVLDIMVDSRLGSYGAIALVIILLTKYQALITLSNSFIPASLVAGHAISRLFSLFVMAKLSYVKPSGKSKPLATKLTHSHLIIATVFGVFPMLLLPMYCWLALIPVALVWVRLLFMMRRKIGGYTGDCLGAMQQITEVTFYLGLVACFELNILLRI